MEYMIQWSRMGNLVGHFIVNIYYTGHKMDDKY
jgi:hypothetical protein